MFVNYYESCSRGEDRLGREKVEVVSWFMVMGENFCGFRMVIVIKVYGYNFRYGFVMFGVCVLFIYFGNFDC